MMHQTKSFYKYVSIHTFLIGLFPFYLPVFLWKLDYSISEISYFIALTGIGYCLTLWSWERLHRVITLKRIILISFLLELLLLSIIFFSEIKLFFPILALLYGAYNCFFWITNRVMFFETVTPLNSGRQFGNFQIMVAVVLKIGVFSGGLLLDRYSYPAIFIFSILVVVLGMLLFGLNTDLELESRSISQAKVISFSHLVRFKDEFRSKFIFMIDGLFLFLESFFWMISLFIMVKESFWQLGILVIILMVIFSLIFYLIKNRIDRMSGEVVYRLSVTFYVLSWIFRGLLKDDFNLPMGFVMLALITFFTSMFRLVFNKRFFDLARTTSHHRYIFLKSYYSQFFIAVLFGILGFALSKISNTEQALSFTYFAAGIIAVGYFWYRPNEIIKEPQPLFNRIRTKGLEFQDT